MQNIGPDNQSGQLSGQPYFLNMEIKNKIMTRTMLLKCCFDTLLASISTLKLLAI